MKKIFKAYIVIITMLLCVGSATCSCGNPKRTIRQVAYQYLDAMANYRVEDAVPYCTPETQEGVIRVGHNLVKAVEPGYIESDTPAKIKIKKVKITSDTTATVSFHKSTPLKEQNGEVNLVFRNGQWKVHILMGYQKKAVGKTDEEDSKPTN